ISRTTSIRTPPVKKSSPTTSGACWNLSRVKARFVHKALRLRQSLITVVISSAIATSSFGFDIRYWVWQRDEPLDEQEVAELAAQHVDTIYWQIGELENVGDTWRWKARFNFPAS